MSHENFIKSTVLTKCEAAGVNKEVAVQAADAAIKNYQNNNFTTVSKLIDLAVTKAKSLTKKKAR